MCVVGVLPRGTPQRSSSRSKAVFDWAPARLNRPTSLGSRHAPPVLVQGAQARLDTLFGQPFDFPGPRFDQAMQAFRRGQLNAARAVLTRLSQQGEGAARGHVERSRPSSQHVLVVGQETPQPRFDPVMTVPPGCERHGERERIGTRRRGPRLVIGERELPSRAAHHMPHDTPARHRGETFAHGGGSRWASTMASVSGTAMPMSAVGGARSPPHHGPRWTCPAAARV